MNKKPGYNVQKYTSLPFIIIISALCHIYSSVNRVNIGSDNGAAPIQRHVVI